MPVNPEPSACIVYVEATASKRGQVADKLRSRGYKVVEVLIDSSHATAIQEGNIPADIKALIDHADLCVFLLPTDGAGDGGLVGVAAQVDGLNKPIIAILDGDRDDVPEIFEDCAAAVLREGSEQLDRVLSGKEVWETREGKPRPDRVIHHVKCQ